LELHVTTTAAVANSILLMVVIVVSTYSWLITFSVLDVSNDRGMDRLARNYPLTCLLTICKFKVAHDGTSIHQLLMKEGLGLDV
jgi:hypothetical protein